MLIYLNRTGYNGLFRVNASGVFNVPPGRYDRPRIVDRALLMRAAGALSADNVRLECAAFNRVLEIAAPGDFVYFDPPYAPLTRTANFRGYTGRGFSDRDQEALQRVVIALAQRGVNVLLSNSTAPSVTELYEHNRDADAAGLRALRVPGAARDQFQCASAAAPWRSWWCRTSSRGWRSGSSRPIGVFGGQIAAAVLRLIG